MTITTLTGPSGRLQLEELGICEYERTPAGLSRALFIPYDQVEAVHAQAKALRVTATGRMIVFAADVPSEIEAVARAIDAKRRPAKPVKRVSPLWDFVRLVTTAVAVVIGVPLGIALLSEVRSQHSISSRAEVAPQRSSSRLTYERYLQLREGMSYQEVASILGGDGVETGRVDMGIRRLGQTVGYQWQDGPRVISVTFQGGKLKVKAQGGLQ